MRQSVLKCRIEALYVPLLVACSESVPTIFTIQSHADFIKIDVPSSLGKDYFIKSIWRKRHSEEIRSIFELGSE
jgi:hypothetical protein